MRERIRKLSCRTELLFVLVVAFGITMPKSLVALLAAETLSLYLLGVSSILCSRKSWCAANVVSALKERPRTDDRGECECRHPRLLSLLPGCARVIRIAPMALLFAYWFARTGRLWPPLVAHALQDFVGLLFSG